MARKESAKRQDDHEPDQAISDLCGSCRDGRSFTEIFANEIRAIVQVAAEEAAIQPPRDLIFFRFPLIDGTGNDPDLLAGFDCIALCKMQKL